MVRGKGHTSRPVHGVLQDHDRLKYNEALPQTEAGPIEFILCAARAARDLGQGWKVNPFPGLPSKEALIIVNEKPVEGEKEK